MLKENNNTATTINNIIIKKIVFTAFFLVITAITGFSQIEKNTLLLGGYASFNYENTNININLNPNTGLFLTDKFCLGISFPIVYYSERFYWGLAPFGRYYFKSGEPKSFYISGAVGITSFLNSDNTLTDQALTLGIGHVWLLNKSVALKQKLSGIQVFTI
jgi:hypothetical protein